MMISQSQDQPSPTQSLRGQIYRAGITVGIACAFLVGGFALAFGVEELTAVSLAMGSFLVVGTLSWVADLLIGPALERVAQQREDERLTRERDLAPAGGGILPSALSLMGGQELLAGVVGGAASKGHRLDITLPEETITTAPEAAIASSRAGVVGGAAFASAGGAIPNAPGVSGVAPGSPVGASATSGANLGGDDFQDLASLLREASEPVPVPAARVR